MHLSREDLSFVVCKLYNVHCTLYNSKAAFYPIKSAASYGEAAAPDINNDSEHTDSMPDDLNTENGDRSNEACSYDSKVLHIRSTHQHESLSGNKGSIQHVDELESSK